MIIWKILLWTYWITKCLFSYLEENLHTWTCTYMHVYRIWKIKSQRNLYNLINPKFLYQNYQHVFHSLLLFSEVDITGVGKGMATVSLNCEWVWYFHHLLPSFSNNLAVNTLFSASRSRSLSRQAEIGSALSTWSAACCRVSPTASSCSVNYKM